MKNIIVSCKLYCAIVVVLIIKIFNLEERAYVVPILNDRNSDENIIKRLKEAQNRRNREGDNATRFREMKPE